MRNPEILAVMVSLEALLETNNEKKALEVVKRVIAQVEVTSKKPVAIKKEPQEE